MHRNILPKIPKSYPTDVSKLGGWLISVNLKSDGAPSFFIRSTQEKVNITYKGEATVINEDGYETGNEGYSARTGNLINEHERYEYMRHSTFNMRTICLLAALSGITVLSAQTR